jgi:acetyltransferase-like isoleucine patch superfamily enzyme
MLCVFPLELRVCFSLGLIIVLKVYFNRKLRIGDGTWIGPQCFIYALEEYILVEMSELDPESS